MTTTDTTSIITFIVIAGASVFILPQVQGDQLYMAVYFWYLVKVIYPVYASTVALDKSLFKRYQKHTAMSTVYMYTGTVTLLP